MCACSVMSDSLRPPRTVAHQASLTTEFFRQDYWSGFPFPTPRDLPDPDIKPASLMPSVLVGRFFTTAPSGKPVYVCTYVHMCLCVHIFVCAVLCLVAQLCPTLCNPMDCSPPGSSVHGDSPGKNTRVGCHAPLQGVFPSQRLNPGRSPSLQDDSLPSEPPGKPKNTGLGSLSLLQGIFPIQESNCGILHCRWILYQLSYQGNPYLCVSVSVCECVCVYFDIIC